MKDEEAIRLEALRQASANARTKAEAIAASLGLQILRISAVSEGERSFQPIMRQASMAYAEAAAAPTPIEPGPVEVRSTVTLTIEVEGR